MDSTTRVVTTLSSAQTLCRAHCYEGSVRESHHVNCFSLVATYTTRGLLNLNKTGYSKKCKLN